MLPDMTLPHSHLPHLLITNDDGIDSNFLRVLAEAHRPHFRVSVAAPKGEQSWIGRAFSRLREVRVEKVQKEFADAAWAIDGTPSDCVNIALGHLLAESPPDIVISGINIGYNVTMPLSLSSGTLAGALEGAAWGLPACAYSLELLDAEYLHAQQNKGDISGTALESLHHAAARAAQFTLAYLGERHEGGLHVHNINFPRHCTPDTPVEDTRPATIRLGALYRETAPGAFHFHWNKRGDSIPVPDGTDAACLRKGQISHTLLNFANFDRAE
jgi:5'-nucleotidase